MCITVDTNDNIIGFDTKFKTHLWDNIQANNILHRAFSIFLFNENYELLLQRRSNEKITFPGCWTNTCCSHPLYLENEKNGVDGCRNAGLRKLIHELGIIHSPPLTYLTRIHYKAFSNEKWGEHEIDYIFFGQGSFHVEPKPNEVLDIQYVNESKLRELLKLAETHPDQVKITPWFKMICENNLFKWWQHLRNGTLESCVEASEIFRMS
ncbi:hypothetical protein HMI55_004741 [Coelomomyces lativittatus]|nr:hypothetical protein HMI55_004741 [Coelomomyces lativittatus]